MVEITEKDKQLFIQAKLKELLSDLNHSEQVSFYLGVGAGFLNLGFIYLIFHAVNSSSVLINLLVSAFVNLILWIGIRKYSQIHDETLKEVIQFEHTYAPIRPHYAEQKFKEEFGYRDLKDLLSNIPLAMMAIYILGAVLVADYKYQILNFLT